MKKGVKIALCIIIPIITVILLLVLVIAGGLLWINHELNSYHDENTFADLTVTSTDQTVNLGAQSSYKNEPVKILTDVNGIQGMFIKGDSFTVDNYEFLVKDVEFEYMIIKIEEGEFYDGKQTLYEGETITLKKGEYVELTQTDTSYTTKIILNNIWWY